MRIILIQWANNKGSGNFCVNKIQPSAAAWTIIIFLPAKWIIQSKAEHLARSCALICDINVTIGNYAAVIRKGNGAASRRGTCTVYFPLFHTPTTGQKRRGVGFPRKTFVPLRDRLAEPNPSSPQRFNTCCSTFIFLKTRDTNETKCTNPGEIQNVPEAPFNIFWSWEVLCANCVIAFFIALVRLP